MLEPRHRLAVLALEEDELARLELVEPVQAVELPLVQREHGLELAEPGGRRVDVVLERVDLVADDLDLGAEHALPLARGLDLLLERADPAVDHPLLLGGAFLARRDRGGEKHEAGQKQADAEA